MTADERMGVLYEELSRLGFDCLVMGGHAVRFHGIDRSTLDFDVHVALDLEDWDALGSTLARSPLMADLREGPSWRPADFRRFILGTLVDGREERLEFWRRNHLLAPFNELFLRRAAGRYGGKDVAFLGIDDLIRSKETEREDDWRDVRLLEELSDESRLAKVADRSDCVYAIANLRSQRGFARAMSARLLDEAALVAEASALATSPVTLAFLAPLAPAPVAQLLPEPQQRILEGPLRSVTPGSDRHRALVEAVRRLYMKQRMAEDRADKELAAAGGPSR